MRVRRRGVAYPVKGLRGFAPVTEIVRLVSRLGEQFHASTSSPVPEISRTSQREIASFHSESSEEQAESESESSETTDTQTDSPEDRGVIYARVSSNQQAEEGKSLEEQIRRLKEIAENRGIQLVTSPIKDSGKTGTNFDREGIKRVRQIAEKEEIEYVLVDDIDRVGRHHAETIYYLYELRSECGVKVITTESGEVDVDDFEGKTHVMLKSLSAQVANENRARRAHASSIEKFKQKNWSVYYDLAPFGYVKTEDDWLEVDEPEAEIVEEVFMTFLRVDEDGPYAKVAERVDGLSESQAANQVRKMLRDSIYVGEASVDTSPPGEETESGVVVPDGELQVVSRSTFNSVQEKIDRIRERYSSSSDEPSEVDEYVDVYGPVAVYESSPIVVIQCPDCRGELRKNGQRTLDGGGSHNYECKECGRQRKFPTQAEFDRMRHYHSETD